MTKAEREKLERDNVRLEKKFQKNIEKAKEIGRKRMARQQRKSEIRERQKQYQRQSLHEQILRHDKLIQQNRDDKSIDRAFGMLDPLKTRIKKDPSEFKGYAYDAVNNSYRVQFTYKKVKYRLGRYDTPEEAHAVYLEERAKKVAEWEAMH